MELNKPQAGAVMLVMDVDEGMGSPTQIRIQDAVDGVEACEEAVAVRGLDPQYVTQYPAFPLVCLSIG